jgi:hypothetical protein
MPLLAHQRASRRPTVTSGDLPPREIEVEPLDVGSGFRWRDILADYYWPLGNLVPGYSEGRREHERALMREYGETPTEEGVRAAMGAEGAWNAMELSPSLPGWVGEYLARTGGGASGRTAQIYREMGEGLKGWVTKPTARTARFGGSGIEPGLNALGWALGMRGQQGGTITPGGPGGQTRWGSAEEILRGDAGAMEREKQDLAALREAQELRGYER